MAQLNFNLPTGSIRVELTPETAKDIQSALDRLMQSLKIVATQTTSATRPTPQRAFEYTHNNGIFLEIFCNPNLYPSPFAAKVLLTVRDAQLRLTVETELNQMIEDVNQFIAAQN